MSLLFSSLIHRGSLIDSVSSTPMTNSGAKFRWVGDKYVADFNGSEYFVNPSIPAFGTSDFSIFIKLKAKVFEDRNIIGSDANGFNLIIHTDGKLLVRKGGVGNVDAYCNTALLLNTEYTIGYKRLGTIGTYYVNGISAGTCNDTFNYTAGVKYFGLGYYNYFNGSISSCRIFSHALSSSEIQQETDYAKNLKCAVKPKRNPSPYIRPTDLSQFKGTGINQGLVAAYSMTNRGGVVTDISGNGNNLTQTGGNVVNAKDGIQFFNSGSFNKIGFTGLNTGLNANQYTVSIRIKFFEITREQDFLIISNSYKYIQTTKIKMDGNSNPLVGNESINFNKWYTINFLVKAPGAEMYINGVSDSSNSNYTENLNSNIITLGGIGNKLNGEIQDIRIHNRILTPNEIKQYHNQFVTPLYLNDFSSDAIGNQPKDFQPNANLVIGELTSKSGVLEKGTKYLKFITAGTAKVPIDLPQYPATISYYYWNGSTWTLRSGLISTPVTGVAYANGYLTFTGASNGDEITGIIVMSGTKQI